MVETTPAIQTLRSVLWFVGGAGDHPTSLPLPARKMLAVYFDNTNGAVSDINMTMAMNTAIRYINSEINALPSTVEENDTIILHPILCIIDVLFVLLNKVKNNCVDQFYRELLGRLHRECAKTSVNVENYLFIYRSHTGNGTFQEEIKAILNTNK